MIWYEPLHWFFIKFFLKAIPSLFWASFTKFGDELELEIICWHLCIKFKFDERMGEGLEIPSYYFILQQEYWIGRSFQVFTLDWI